MSLYYRFAKGSRLREKGFTLIELLVVIAIIGILASIIMVSLTSARAKGRDAKRIADIRNIQLALEIYYNDNGHYPCDIYDVSAAGVCAPTFMGTYLSTTPTDPSTNPNPVTVCGVVGTRTNAGCYFYNAMYTGSPPGAAGSSNFYHLGAKLEDITNSGLTQDVDFVISGTYGVSTNNKGTAAIDGTSITCNGTAGTKEPGGTELCYDVTP